MLQSKEEVTAVAKLVRQRGSWVECVKERYTPDDFDQQVSIGLRRRTGKRGPMSVAEKIRVCHQVLIEHDFQTDVAKEHRISNAMVSKLVKKAVKNKHFLDELMEKQQDQQMKVDAIVDVINDLNNRDTFIESAASVARILKDGHGIEAKT